MANSRAFLIECLRRVDNGETVTREQLDAGCPAPKESGEFERLAWQSLSHWIDDEDIRLIDATYAAMQAQKISASLEDLEAIEAGHLPIEVSRGEHQASHLPKAAIVGGAIFLLVAAILIFVAGTLLVSRKAEAPPRQPSDAKSSSELNSSPATKD